MRLKYEINRGRERLMSMRKEYGKRLLPLAVAVFITVVTGVACSPKADNIVKKGIVEVKENTDDTLSITTERQYADRLDKTSLQAIRITIAQGKGVLQTINYRYNWEDGKPMDISELGDVEYKDVNFDNQHDLLIFLGRYGNQGVAYYECFLWNDSLQQFKIEPTFRTIENPEINAANQCIYASARDAANQYWIGKYIYNGKGFVRQKGLTIRYEGHTPHYTEETYSENGKKPIAETQKNLNELNKEWRSLLKE